jgi:myo-inositol-1(or 4)-monophosphatase
MKSMKVRAWDVQALIPKVQYDSHVGECRHYVGVGSQRSIDCYWEYDLSSWDVAAGALLVTEAGGRYTDLAGVDFPPRTRKMCSNSLESMTALSVFFFFLNEAGIQ